MKILLTGATGGIGQAILQELLKDDQTEVYGIARRNSEITHKNYHHVNCDIQDLKQVEIIAKQFATQWPQLDAVILAAGVGKFNELEQFSLTDMQMLVNINFLSQAALVKLLLPLLKKNDNSKIIAIGSEAAIHGAKKGTMYCAAKFALRGFLQSLRAECSQSKTAVTIINPGLVKTEFFDNLNFAPGDTDENSITAEQIAKTVAYVLAMENNCVVEEITLQPMKKVIQKKLLNT